MSQTENSLQKIASELGDPVLKYPDWLLSDFQTILKQAPIRTMLDEAFAETLKGYMSIHGADHGLAVAYNTLSLFKMIHLNVVESDYVREFDFKKEYVLFALLVASYVHDVGRFYRPEANHEEEVENARKILMELVKDRRILRGLSLEVARGVLDSVKDLCMHIDKKDEVSEKTEHAMIKLADLLDCGKSRTYSEDQIPELGREHGEQMRKILQNDKHPEKHFGFLSMDDTQLEWKEQENIFQITLTIKDYAAAAEIKRILSVLELNERGSEAVRGLSRRVRLLIKDPKTRYVLYPRNIIRLPGARFRNVLYEIDIQNTSGDAEIFSMFEIQNVSDKAGISSHTFRMWGLDRTEWGSPKGVIVKVTDSDGKELETKYERAERDGIGHTWTTLFNKTIELNQIIKLAGRYSWKKFVNVKGDEFDQAIVTPTDRLEVKIFFPEGIRKESIDAKLDIRSSEAVLFCMSANNSIFHDKKRDRTYIQIVMDNLINNYTYRILWKMKD